LTPLKRFLHLKMLNFSPKWHKLMPEIPDVWFSGGNSNYQRPTCTGTSNLATEIQTNFNNLPWQNVPKLCWKVKKRTRCKGVHACWGKSEKCSSLITGWPSADQFLTVTDRSCRCSTGVAQV
jgi:hypothetical protein